MILFVELLSQYMQQPEQKKLIYKETQEVSTPKQESLQNKVNNTYIVFMLKHNVGDSISNIV